jgi:arginine deiminase
MDKSDRVLNVTSEIGTLKSVLLHRPGKELENLVPDYLERLLFDDIPYLEIAQKEHDKFAQVLRDNGAEVVYLEDLAAKSIEDKAVRNSLIQEFLDEANIYDEKLRYCLEDYFSQFNNRDLINKMIAGIRKTEVPNYRSNMPLLDDGYPFITDPMPNLYFTRDPFAVVGNGITLHHMRTITRNRETLFLKYIFENNDKLKNVPYWYDRDEKTSLEGGDILVLGNGNLAIGISQRTDAESVVKVAEKLLYSDQSFERILAFYIPRKRAFMHLDTVFTAVDRDKFTIHPEIEGTLTVYSITKSDKKDKKLNIVEEEAKLEDILKKYMELDKVDLIRCAGGDPIDAPREQWNDGSNTLAIAPGEVVVYDRNYVTNRILEEKGIKVHEIESSELSRGRGGPRCMSMPLFREDL